MTLSERGTLYLGGLSNPLDLIASVISSPRSIIELVRRLALVGKLRGYDPEFLFLITDRQQGGPHERHHD